MSWYEYIVLARSRYEPKTLTRVSAAQRQDRLVPRLWKLIDTFARLPHPDSDSSDCDFPH
jgi:hypothetical protein